MLITYSCRNPWPEGNIQIIEEYPGVDTDTSANPIAYKVWVHKTHFMGPAYHVSFNYMYEDTARTGGAIWGADSIYDMVFYKWRNDSMVDIRLYNSVTGIKEEFFVYGFPGGSGLGWDDEGE